MDCCACIILVRAYMSGQNIKELGMPFASFAFCQTTFVQARVSIDNIEVKE